MDGVLAGVDIGGAFADCVVVSEDGEAAMDKALSFPPDYIEGVVDGPSLATAKFGLSLSDLRLRFQ